MTIFKNFNTLDVLNLLGIIMDKKKDSNNKKHISYFHDTIVDISKLLTNDEHTQDNIQMGIYSVTGVFTGLAFFNSNKKNEIENRK